MRGAAKISLTEEPRPAVGCLAVSCLTWAEAGVESPQLKPLPAVAGNLRALRSLSSWRLTYAGHGFRSPEDGGLHLALRKTMRDRMFTALRYADLGYEVLRTAADVSARSCCWTAASAARHCKAP